MISSARRWSGAAVRDDLEASLGALAALGERSGPDYALGAAYIASVLGSRSFRLARRDRAIRALAESYYAIGSTRSMASAIATALSRFAGRRDRASPDARDALLA